MSKRMDFDTIFYNAAFIILIQMFYELKLTNAECLQISYAY